MIYIPKYTDIIADPIKVSMGYKGEFKITMRDENGRFLYDTDWMPNLMTTFCLENIVNNNFQTYMVVGTGNTAPAITDTALDAFVGASTSIGAPADVQLNEGAPDYETTLVKGYRFNAGVGTGTLAEMGLSNRSDGTDLNVRALISPPIVKGASQIMDITHRHYAFRDHVNPQVDLTGVISIGGENYNYTLRPMFAGRYASTSNFGNCTRFSTMLAHSTEIVDFLDHPNTLELGTTPSSSQDTAYVPLSYERTTTSTWGVDKANFAPGGIRTISLGDTVAETSGQGGNSTKAGYQCRLGKVSDDSPVPKTDNDQFTFTATRSWRRVP